MMPPVLYILWHIVMIDVKTKLGLNNALEIAFVVAEILLTFASAVTVESRREGMDSTTIMKMYPIVIFAEIVGLVLLLGTVCVSIKEIGGFFMHQWKKKKSMSKMASGEGRSYFARLA